MKKSTSTVLFAAALLLAANTNAFEVIDNATNEVVASHPETVTDVVKESDNHPSDDDDVMKSVVDDFIDELLAAEDGAEMFDALEESIEDFQHAESTLNVNDKQHTVFSTDEGEEIEDLSEDTALEAEDKLLEKQNKNTPKGKGGLLGDLFGVDPDMGSDYIEEKTDKDGHHVRKEVHSGPGFHTETITMDHPMSGDEMNQMVQGLLGSIMGGPPPKMNSGGGATMRQISSSGPMIILGGGDDDLDDDHDAQEAFEMMRQMEENMRKQADTMANNLFGNNIFGIPQHTAKQGSTVAEDHQLALSSVPASSTTTASSSSAGEATADKTSSSAKSGTTTAQANETQPAIHHYQYTLMALGFVATVGIFYFLSSIFTEKQQQSGAEKEKEYEIKLNTFEKGNKTQGFTIETDKLSKND